MFNLTDKTYIICLTNNIKIYLTKKQAKQCKEAVILNKKFIIIDERLFNVKVINYIVPAYELENAKKRLKGEWMCPSGTWHQYGELCGHG